MGTKKQSGKNDTALTNDTPHFVDITDGGDAWDDPAYRAMFMPVGEDEKAEN